MLYQIFFIFDFTVFYFPETSTRRAKSPSYGGQLEIEFAAINIPAFQVSGGAKKKEKGDI